MKEQIEAVQSMQNYIESRWQESITLAVLSEVSHFLPGILPGHTDGSDSHGPLRPVGNRSGP